MDIIKQSLSWRWQVCLWSRSPWKHHLPIIFTWYSHTLDLDVFDSCLNVVLAAAVVTPHAWNLSALVYMRSLAATLKHVLHPAVIKVLLTCMWNDVHFIHRLFSLLLHLSDYSFHFHVKLDWPELLADAEWVSFLLFKPTIACITVANLIVPCRIHLSD